MAATQAVQQPPANQLNLLQCTATSQVSQQTRAEGWGVGRVSGNFCMLMLVADWAVMSPAALGGSCPHHLLADDTAAPEPFL